MAMAKVTDRTTAYAKAGGVTAIQWDSQKIPGNYWGDSSKLSVGGVTYTATAHDWYESMQGNTITATITGTTETAQLAFPYSTNAEEAQMRIEVLAGMENAVLMNYNFIPLMGDSSASLKGMQIEYYTEDQVFPMGRGGVKYMTYNYTDAEWTAFVAEQGGVLNYK